MITVQVFTECGDSWCTGINATLEGARTYFLGKWFNLGIEGDRMVLVNRVELLEKEPC